MISEHLDLVQVWSSIWTCIYIYTTYRCPLCGGRADRISKKWWELLQIAPPLQHFRMLQYPWFQFSNSVRCWLQDYEYRVTNRTEIMKIITVIEIVRNVSEGSDLYKGLWKAVAMTQSDIAQFTLSDLAGHHELNHGKKEKCTVTAPKCKSYSSIWKSLQLQGIRLNFYSYHTFTILTLK